MATGLEAELVALFMLRWAMVRLPAAVLLRASTLLGFLFWCGVVAALVKKGRLGILPHFKCILPVAIFGIVGDRRFLFLGHSFVSPYSHLLHRSFSAPVG